MSADDSVTDHDSGMYSDAFIKGNDDFVNDTVHPFLDNESSTMDNKNSFTINDDSAINIDNSDSYVGDDWPKMADGSVFDDTELFALVHRGNSPF